MKKRIAILGSTGSIGGQALEVIKDNQDLFQLEVLTANDNTDLLVSQAMEYNPNVVVIGNKEHYKDIKDKLSNFPIKVYAGEESIEQIVEMDTIDVVLDAIVGFAGLKPLLNAIDNEKQIALANKETLVVAGKIVMKKVKMAGIDLIPVDSEHSAIFQCMAGEWHNEIEKIILTASGGPFHRYSADQLKGVNKEKALNHPNWNMGDKITIDSASLMNKGLEVIEAHWLFNVPVERIEVVIHPQSIIHSMVMFSDGSIKAQMGLPDMRIPIQYALSYPRRIRSEFPRLNMQDYASLTFDLADTEKFRNLALAFEAIEKGGNLPCILNAANEMVVEAFLLEKIGFTEMPEIIEACFRSVPFIKDPDINDLFETDRLARIRASENINN